MSSDASGPDRAAEHRDETVTEHLVTFLLPLPDPLPIAHGTTHTRFLPWPVKALEGMLLTPESGAAHFPEETAGQQFVSIKFWQVKEPPRRADTDELNAVLKVLRDVNGGEPPAVQPYAGIDGSPQYRTVVQMVTVAAMPPGGEPFIHGGVDQSEPFDRCFAHLQQVFRAYRLSEQAFVPELTYQRLPPYVVMLRRDLHDPDPQASAASLMMLNHMWVSTMSAPEQLDRARQERLNTFLTQLSQGNPFALAAERSVQADTALHRDGDYGHAVVQCALSVEVLLDGLLGVMLWEESLAAPDPQKAADVLSKPFAAKVKQEFHPRLGGHWALDRPGPLQEWSTRIAYLRGRVVHRGYRPTEAEARRALATAEALGTFVRQRIAGKAGRYSRTALMLLGRPGLERLGAWKQVARFAETTAGAEPPWSRSYSTWRDAVDLLVRP